MYMENLVISLNVVLPLFLLIALGYVLRKLGMYDAVTLKTINKLVFKVFLPVYLFYSIYSTDLSAAFDIKVIIFAVVGLMLWFLLLLFLVPLYEKDHAKCGVMVQAMFRSNFVLFGLPVAISLCGEDRIGITSLLLGIIIPIYNVLAVVTLEIFRGGKPSIKKIVTGIVTNPLIIASLLGVGIYIMKIDLPYAIEKTVVDIGKVATPLALIALGGEFRFCKVKGNIKQLMVSVAGKLVISPLFMVTVAILLGFRNEILVPILLMSGAPTAVSSYTMAQQMGGDGELAGEIVVFTTGISIVTIFIWVFVLKQFNFI